MRRILLTLIATIALTVAAGARTLREYTAMPLPGARYPFTLTVDSIDFRSDLVRIYGHLLATPHSSARIDGFTVSEGDKVLAPADMKSYPANDIDGFEFTHRFQWEDDGDLPVEIDFPAFKPQNAFLISAATPSGPVVWALRRTSSAKSTKGTKAVKHAK